MRLMALMGTTAETSRAGAAGDGFVPGLGEAVAVGGDEEEFFAFLLKEDAVDGVAGHFLGGGEAGAVEQLPEAPAEREKSGVPSKAETGGNSSAL